LQTAVESPIWWLSGPPGLRTQHTTDRREAQEGVRRSRSSSTPGGEAFKLSTQGAVPIALGVGGVLVELEGCSVARAQMLLVGASLVSLVL
jgi:hypothetical protein